MFRYYLPSPLKLLIGWGGRTPARSIFLPVIYYICNYANRIIASVRKQARLTVRRGCSVRLGPPIIRFKLGGSALKWHGLRKRWVFLCFGIFRTTYNVLIFVCVPRSLVPSLPYVPRNCVPSSDVPHTIILRPENLPTCRIAYTLYRLIYRSVRALCSVVVS